MAPYQIKKRMKSAILIDDDPVTNVINMKMLKKYMPVGNISAYMTQEEVFSHMERLKPEKYPELMLIDIRMPKVDGFMLAFELISHFPHLTNHSKFYFLSSTLDPKEVELARNMPISKGFIRKPLSKELLETLFQDNDVS
jgi:response regulator of citrate/malate metabolism